jgi:hypothetical protein
MIDEIYLLRDQMLNLGYTSGEIDRWIRHVIGDIPIEQLSEQDCTELISQLKSYISYAKNKQASC